MRQLVLGLAGATLATLLMGSSIAAQGRPEFQLGFRALANKIPNVVGQPVEAEHWGTNGDSVQQTTSGLMVWRKADNWTAFTDGSQTWVSGPSGIQQRDNNERFNWEADSPRKPVQDFHAFAGDWDRHGLYLTINAAGLAEAEWRTYNWCKDARSGIACDRMDGNVIMNGGLGHIILNKVEGSVASGVVTFSNSDNWFKQGNPITFTLLPYGLLRMETPGRNPEMLCGERYYKEAPDDVRRSSPCGA